MRNLFKRLGWVALAVVILAFLWLIPQLQGMYFSQDVPPEEIPALVNEYRRTWAQITGGFALLLGLYFTWRRVEISQQTLEATQDQQVTERFTRATDQLGATDESGNPRLEIRLGGIYALERIARDSPDRDYSTVIEVLAAYVRENVPWSSEQDGDTYQYKASMLQWAPTDIQAILDVFKRLEENRGSRKEPRVRLNLMSTHLRAANLEGACLEGAVLTQTNLEGADLNGAHLEGARLEGANLEGANLEGANLAGAVLWGTPALIQEQINKAYGSKTTLLPEGIVHPEHWRKGTDEQTDREG